MESLRHALFRVFWKEKRMATSTSSRDSFTSRTAFIIACIGSAVGMSAIWLFPYRVAEMGGAAFLHPILYLRRFAWPDGCYRGDGVWASHGHRSHGCIFKGA